MKKDNTITGILGEITKTVQQTRLNSKYRSITNVLLEYYLDHQILVKFA